MPVKTIPFREAAGRISTKVICGHAQAGSYRLRLWEPMGNVKIFEQEGTFINQDDDEYDLPLPNTKNDGRFVQCLASIVMISAGEYNLIVEFRQGDNFIDSVNADGRTDKESVEVQVMAELKQEG